MEVIIKQSHRNKNKTLLWILPLFLFLFLFLFPFINAIDTELVYAVKNNNQIIRYAPLYDWEIDGQSEIFAGGVYGLSKNSINDNHIFFYTQVATGRYEIVKLNKTTLTIEQQGLNTYNMMLGKDALAVDNDFIFYRAMNSAYSSSAPSQAYTENLSSTGVYTMGGTSRLPIFFKLDDDYLYYTLHSNNPIVYKREKTTSNLIDSVNLKCTSSTPTNLDIDDIYLYWSCGAFGGSDNPAKQFNKSNFSDYINFSVLSIKVYTDNEFFYSPTGTGSERWFNKYLNSNINSPFQSSPIFTTGINGIVADDNLVYFSTSNELGIVDRDFIQNQAGTILEETGLRIIYVETAEPLFEFIAPELLFTPANLTLPYNFAINLEPEFYFNNSNYIDVIYINPLTKEEVILKNGTAKREYSQFNLHYVNESYLRIETKNKDYSFYITYRAYNNNGYTDTRFIVSIIEDGDVLILPEDFQKIEYKTGAGRVFFDGLISIFEGIYPDSDTLTLRQKFMYILLTFLIINILLIILSPTKVMLYIAVLINFVLLIWFMAIGYFPFILIILLFLIIVLILILNKLYNN